MPIYNPPALNAVNFSLTVEPAHSVAPYLNTLSVYTAPALNAVDFVLSLYTPPVYNTIDFELLASAIIGQIKVWLGSSWEAKPVKIFNGSTWEVQPVKYFNGSTWVTTSY